jgi:hypothetical protein
MALAILRGLLSSPNSGISCRPAVALAILRDLLAATGWVQGPSTRLSIRFPQSLPLLRYTRMTNPDAGLTHLSMESIWGIHFLLKDDRIESKSLDVFKIPVE